MNRDLRALLLAQFLSAFADNAILFTAIAMTIQAGQSAAWYIPALQAAFLVAFVLLAPWVGPFADRRPKTHVLITANAIKGLGAGLMCMQVEPLLAYAVVGIGAAMYGPAKYGILPEMVPPEQLVRANGWIESSTILAILMGSYVGARIADHSITLALLTILASYALSILIATWIRKTPPHGQHSQAALPHFIGITRTLFQIERARFAVLGTSLFWAAAAVLRLMLVAWAPVVLMTRNASQIAELTLYIAIGITIGALLAPRLIGMQHLHRARLAAYLMGGCVILLALVESLWPARIALLLIGCCGGLFVVPINAVLQDIGHRSVGSGSTVAVQNFSENLAMLAATGIYTLATTQQVSSVTAIFALGVLILIATALVTIGVSKDRRTW